MKTVFSSQELPHVWAHQSAEYGRSPSALSFQGKVLRSYATDIGVILETGRAVLLNGTRYSNTTSKQQGRMRGAVSHYPLRFEVDGLDRGEALRRMSGAEVVDNLLAQAVRLHAESLKARSHDRKGYLTTAAKMKVAELNEAAQFFKLRRKPVGPEEMAHLAGLHARRVAAVNRKEAKERAAAEARRKEYEAERKRVFLAEALPEWRRGERSNLFGGVNYFDATADGFAQNAALRLNEDKTRVETSQGAQVMVRSVAFLWPFVAKARVTGEAVAADLIARFPALDHYAVHAIDAFGNLSAGCHSIAFAEIEGIARELGLPPFNGEKLPLPEIPWAGKVVAS